MNKETKKEIELLLKQAHIVSYKEGFLEALNVVTKMKVPKNYTPDAKVYFDDTKRNIESELMEWLLSKPK